MLADIAGSKKFSEKSLIVKALSSYFINFMMVLKCIGKLNKLGKRKMVSEHTKKRTK